MSKQHYIISYDISSHPLRTKMAKLLQRHGCERMQRSVFLAANMKTEELLLLKNAGKSMMVGHPGFRPTDSLLCFSIQKQAVEEMVWEGGMAELRRIVEKLLFVIM